MHEIFRDTTVIPILTVENPNDAVPLARALVRGGLRVIEVTLRTPGALGAIEAIARQVPEACIGAGTLLSVADFGRARDAGARFLVSPCLTPDLAAAGLGSMLPYLPAVVTPSEVLAARELGFSLLKFFPAVPAGGTAMLRALAPVFQGVVFCPTGGVTGENAAEFLALPNVPMVGGSWMVPAAALSSGDWAAIERAAAVAAALRPAKTVQR
jgi:2-dehydro-3-deoxyphosphogluconate aldolase/(4S)-4-hydroxy-2-oxoglutarate aldolase